MDDSRIPRRDYLKDKAVGIEKQLLRLPVSFHKQGHTCTHEHITIHMVTQKHINTHTHIQERIQILSVGKNIVKLDTFLLLLKM